MSLLRSLLVFYAYILLNKSDAARILVVVPTPSISHHMVFRPLTQELARRGHDVVFMTTDPAFPKGNSPNSPKQLTEIDVHDISYEVRRKFFKDIKRGEKTFLKTELEIVLMTCLKVFEAQTRVHEMQEIIRNQSEKFDLIIVEAWARYPLAFSHVKKTPVIAASSLGALFDNYNVIGSVTHPFLHSSGSIKIYNLTLEEKIVQYYNLQSIKYLHNQNLETENAVVRSIFGEDTPCLTKLQNNVGLLLLNVHTIWEGNRPVPPGVIYMGGLHQMPPKELPKDLKTYLDSSLNGVIYISFGTNINTTELPQEKINTFIKVFSELPYDVLWKWDEEELPGRTKNIQISKWYPQSDLLRHSKIKLFITQGGLQSTDEAITAGVPLIGIPMSTEQCGNVEKYVHHRIGLQLHLYNIEADVLKIAIETIIGDKSYRENIIRLRTIIYDKPMSSLERAVWWTEHVLRHGGARHLRAPAANMPWTQYYEIELVLTVLCVMLAMIVLILLLIYKMVTMFSRKIRSIIILTKFKNDTK